MNCEIYECQKCRGYSSLVYKLPAVIVCSDCHSKPSPEQARIAHLEQQAARLANLPGLPLRFTLPFHKKWYGASDNRPVDAKGYAFCAGLSDEEGTWLVNLLNTCYPPSLGQGGDTTGQEG